MRVVIHAKILGTKKHLSYDTVSKEYSWKRYVADQAWCVGFNDVAKDLSVVCDLFSLPKPEFFPEAQARAFSTLCNEKIENVPWHLALRRDDYESTLQDALLRTETALELIQETNYGSTFISNRKFLLDLSRCPVNLSRLNKHLLKETNPTIQSSLKTFTPDKSGLAKKTVYSQVSTSTGRLTVKEGPQILTLPARCRDILEERPGKKLLQVDFVSLEPRVIRLITHSEAPKDIYDYMTHEIFNDSLDRSQAKLATLCALYGVSQKRLGTALNGAASPKNVIERVKRYFGVEQLSKSLKEELRNTRFIQNLFGRRLKISDYSEHMLISHFVQSSSVDIALLGFQKLISDTKEKSIDVKPMYVIHDAIIVEIDEMCCDKFTNHASLGIKIDGLGNFPVSVKDITVTDQ